MKKRAKAKPTVKTLPVKTPTFGSAPLPPGSLTAIVPGGRATVKATLTGTGALAATIPASRTATAATKPKDKKERKFEIYVPKRPKEKQEWINIWREVRRMADNGESVPGILTWLKKAHPNWKCKEERLREIINAGQAGLLHGRVENPR